MRSGGRGAANGRVEGEKQCIDCRGAGAQTKWRAKGSALGAHVWRMRAEHLWVDRPALGYPPVLQVGFANTGVVYCSFRKCARLAGRRYVAGQHRLPVSSASASWTPVCCSAEVKSCASQAPDENVTHTIALLTRACRDCRQRGQVGVTREEARRRARLSATDLKPPGGLWQS